MAVFLLHFPCSKGLGECLCCGVVKLVQSNPLGEEAAPRAVAPVREPDTAAQRGGCVLPAQAPGSACRGICISLALAFKSVQC